MEFNLTNPTSSLEKIVFFGKYILNSLRTPRLTQPQNHTSHTASKLHISHRLRTIHLTQPQNHTSHTASEPYISHTTSASHTVVYVASMQQS